MAKLCGFLAVWGASLPAPAHAAELHYQAPDECPAGESVQEEVERLLGRKLAESPLVDVTLLVIGAAPADWRVTLQVREPGAAEPRIRELTGHSCADVTDAAAVAVALAIRERDAEPEPKVTSTTAEKPQPPAPPLEPERASKPDRKAKGRRAEPGLGASWLVDSGALPKLGFGVEASAFVDFPEPGVRLGLLGGLLGPREGRAQNSAGGRFSLFFAGAEACGQRSLGPVEAFGCGAMEVGSLRGEGLVSAPRLGSSLWLAPRVELGLRVPLGAGFSASLRGGAAFPMIRRTFVVNADSPIYHPEIPSARFSAGVELSL